MSSLFLLVCQLYKVMLGKAPPPPIHPPPALTSLLSSGGEAGGVQRRPAQTGQELLLSPGQAPEEPLTHVMNKANSSSGFHIIYWHLLLKTPCAPKNLSA